MHARAVNCQTMFSFIIFISLFFFCLFLRSFVCFILFYLHVNLISIVLIVHVFFFLATVLLLLLLSTEWHFHYNVSFRLCRKIRPAQRRRLNDRLMRFDKDDTHQEKTLYANSLYDLHDTLASKLVSKHIHILCSMLGC